jgi:hypothetical protein
MRGHDFVKKYYIFGAHSRAQTLGVYLQKLYPDWKLLGYLYDDDEDNPEAVEGVPVFKIDAAGENDLDTSADAYIGTRGVNFAHAEEVLKSIGFSEIHYYDIELDNDLRNRFIPEYYKDHGRVFVKLEDQLKEPRPVEAHINEQPDKSCKSNNTIYVVRSIYDSPIDNEPALRPYESYIQAGKALTDQTIISCSIFDDAGDNISDKNKQMCELTAMYWIWKNSDRKVVGLEHYRRRFILPEDFGRVFDDGKADVILPVPLLVRPSLMENYTSRHLGETWAAMMEALEELHPECVDAAKEFLEGTAVYSPCNMLIARKEAFDEMCKWLFPVLFKVQEKCGIFGDKYQDRYPGFLAERLMTLYFYWKRDEIKVVYADKVFLK